MMRNDVNYRPRGSRDACVLSILALVLALGATVGSAQSTSSAQLETFIDEFVGATDRAAVRDLSAQSFAEQVARTRAQLERLRAIDRSKLRPDEQIDWRFAESILLGRSIDQERIQSWKRDPRVYLALRPVSAAIGRPGDGLEKPDAVLRLLKAIPIQVRNGASNLTIHVPRFRELGLFMARGATTIFDKEVPAFAATVPARKDEILAANTAARRAISEFVSFLDTELRRKPQGDFAVGTETYDLMLRHQYMLPYDSASLYEFAWQQFNKTVSELEAVAKRIDPSKSWQQIAAEVKRACPEPSRMIEAHQEWVDKAAAHIKSKGLVPIPWKERVNVVPRAEYLRKTSYYGNFSRAQRQNDSGTFAAEWQINPFEPQWDAQTQQEYLLEHDWGVIIVTAPHETYAGHHIQGLYQMHNPRKLRRTQGISIFSEGWGLYNEQLMQETGFFPDERIHLRQLQLRLWRNARVVWDVGIHTGRMSYEDAVSLLSDRVGFLRWAAELEVDGSAQAPGYRIGYFMGMSEILKMREEFRERMGARFSLRDFHERLLKVGNMPPALMREGLMLGITRTN
jgi:uncharacterized protein (DUF885 family)